MDNDSPILVPAARYAAVEMRRYVALTVVAAALPVVVCGIIAMLHGDWRFLLLALILMFIVYPGVASVAWLSMVARPEVAKRLRPHRWTFGDDAMTVTYYRNVGDGELEPVDTAMIAYGEVVKVEMGRRYAVFYLSEPTLCRPGEYYIIPASLLPMGLANDLTAQIYERT